MKQLLITLTLLFATSSFALTDDIDILEKSSLLYKASILAKKYTYPLSKLPRKKRDYPTVWLNAPSWSISKEAHKNALQTLSQEKLLEILQNIGFDAIDVGPLKITGSNNPFIDPKIGTLQDYLKLVDTANTHKIVTIGDIDIACIDYGPDFTLALKNYQDYPTIFHLIEIKKENWSILPDTKQDGAMVLTWQRAKDLKKKGYFLGKTDSSFFSSKRNWKVTGKIEGVDGKIRRWIYLTFENKPMLRFLHPTFAANKILIAKAIYSLKVLHNKILQFRNIPLKAQPPLLAANILAMQVQKLGGYVTKENNVFPHRNSYFNFSYDPTLPLVSLHAIVKQNADALKAFMSQKKHIDKTKVIHARQNLKFPFCRLEVLYSPQKFRYMGKKLSAREFCKILQNDLFQLLPKTPSDNLKKEQPLYATTIEYLSLALGIKNINEATKNQKEQIKKAHLLYTFFCAMQPGILSISAADIVGAYPLPTEKGSLAPHYWQEGYDLLGMEMPNFTINISPSKQLYGPLPQQIKDPLSFVSELRRILKARRAYKVYLAKFLYNLNTKESPLYVALYKLPFTDHLLMICLNFSPHPLKETLKISRIINKSATNIITHQKEKKELSSPHFILDLQPFEGKALLFRPQIKTSQQK